MSKGLSWLRCERSHRMYTDDAVANEGGATMGLIHVTVSLRATQKSRKKYEADFLVDTGATDSMAPTAGLARAGIRPRGRMTYEWADGSLTEYDFGLAEIEFMGELTSGRVIFGPDDC